MHPAKTLGIGVLLQSPDTALEGARRLGLYASATNEPHQNHDNGDDEKNMDEPSHRVGRHQSLNPQNDQDNGNGIEHGKILSM